MTLPRPTVTRSLGATAFLALAPLCLGLVSCTISAADLDPSSDEVLVCHKGRSTLKVPKPALDAHLAHGDTLGPCR